MRTPTNFKELIDLFLNAIGLILPIIAGLCVLAFVWGLAKFILNASNSKTQGEGRQFMIWSVIALFVLVTLWGIIAFAKSEFGFSGGTIVPLLPEK